jgi:hypothetical protein
MTAQPLAVVPPAPSGAPQPLLELRHVVKEFDVTRGIIAR